ncbi:MAG: hypothetical protein MI974_31815 [Chitinophagales bacterium]|nr:hypothetical protein [Chitinophagales bacterium]
MRNALFIIVIGLFSSMTYQGNYEVTKASAEVNKHHGIYIFTDSTPLSEYEVLGSIKKGLSWSKIKLISHVYTVVE